ncbi:MAG TPA: hypothetical protein VGI87_02650 [Solirubrobacteraceae bacterium]
MSPPRLWLATGLVGAGLILAAAPAAADPITEFPIEPGSAAGAHAPRYIHPGPDGALWFTDGGSNYGIERITTDGTFEPVIGTSVRTEDLVTDPSGLVFWTGDGGYGFRTPSGGGTNISAPDLQGGATALDGSGDVVWTNQDHLGNSSLCQPDGALPDLKCNFIAGPTRLTGLALDPRGELWATAYEQNAVYRIMPDLKTTDLKLDPPAHSGPSRIALGSDGNMWVTMFDASAIDRITLAGVRKRFPLPAAGLEPTDITLGPDGALWFTEYNGEAIGRMTTDGTVTNTFPVPTAGANPAGITSGPDGALWFTEISSGKIGRLVIPPNTGGGPGEGGGGDSVAPTFLRGAHFSVKRFRVSSANTPVSARASKGTTLSYSLSEPSTVKIRIARKAAGRKVHGSCRAPSGKNRGGRHCTRYVTVATLTRHGAQGINIVPFSGRIRHRALKPGGYRASVTAKDAAGNTSKASSAVFTIVK